ncbi:hypothetical protein [Mastigocoleus sp. MO_188.B34]|uniref:hypothetical protein n=1 Tax=Mastigocoleus sp. MO_188.B34 TaxID=3036635 RepID=UPI0026029984|nr:hypothetical protein [Mastigocoleus sp. MO_188.B34]MDJ0693049.1 hypothetical protein [Mastigocoleus sp. MO_188.B34]
MLTQTKNFQVKAVSSDKDREIFLDVPHIVYKNDANWVPPFRSSIAKQLAPENAFRQHGELQQFIALSETGKPLGRIVAAINHRLIESEGKNIGIFGYFECIEDFEVAQALLEAACQWLCEHNMESVRGPIDLSTHNRCLFQVDRFDLPPMIMTPYNPSYYPEFIEKAGWEKGNDAYIYNFPLDKPLDPKFEKAYRIACKSGITFRALRTKGEEFEQDCQNMYNLMSEAFAKNYSYIYRTQEEFMAQARELQQMADPDVFPIAEHNGEMIGFWMGLPDYNIVLKHLNGKFDWWGMIKFLWYRRQIDQGVVPVIVSLPEYRRKMVPLALIYLGMQGGIKKGKPYKRAELGWVWETNSPSRKLIEASGGKIYKTYRMYEKAL